jgi:hypothetical protein
MKTARFVILPLLLLAACTSVKRELGVGRNSPDEFTVVKRAPLTLPPDYALRPPADATLQAASAAPETAKNVILGAGGAPVTPASADNAFLDRLGAERADGAIREKINADNGYIALKNRTVADKLIFWQDAQPSDDKIPSSVVDAPAEAERIKQDKQEGKPVTGEGACVIEKKKNTLDKIF